MKHSCPRNCRINLAKLDMMLTVVYSSFDINNVSLSKISKAVADGPVGQVLAGPVSECNKNILIISITMLT